MRSGSAERFLNEGSRGWTWAFSLAELYSGEFGAAPDSTATEELPPWQSVQPRWTVFVGCIVGSSVEVWQEIQPEDLRSASSCGWPRNGGAACGNFAGRVGGAHLGRKRDNAETQRTQRVRREDETGWRSLFMIGASQKVNFTEPKSEKSVGLG